MYRRRRRDRGNMKFWWKLNSSKSISEDAKKFFFFSKQFPFHKRAHPSQHIQRAPFLNLLWKLGKLKKFSLLSRHHFGIVLRHLHIKILFYCIARRCFLALNSLSRSGFFLAIETPAFVGIKQKIHWTTPECSSPTWMSSMTRGNFFHEHDFHLFSSLHILLFI